MSITLPFADDVNQCIFIRCERKPDLNPNNQMDMNERHRTLFQMSESFMSANRLSALLRLGGASRQSSGR